MKSLIPTVALAAGIVVSASVGLPWWSGLVLLLISAVCYWAIMRKSGDPVSAYRLGKWHLVWVALLFAATGIIDENLNRPLSLEKAFGSKVPANVAAEVVSVLSKTYGDRLDVEILGTNGAKARIRTGVAAFTQGDVIEFPSSLLRELSTDTSRYIQTVAPMLRSHGIYYTGFVPVKQIHVSGTSKSFTTFCGNMRTAIEIKIEQSRLQKRTSGFLKAILMGDKEGLDESVRLTFAHGGFAHVLALSGLHMGILAGFLMFMMWPARLVGKYKWGYAGAIVLLWTYVFVTGMALSSVRACIMITFAFFAVIAERRNAVGHALCCACMLILLVSPMAVFDAGFQFSVVCVASLIAFASRLNPVSHRRHPRLFRLCEALLATMVASLASLPFTSYYFSQIPLMFLPVNLLLLPLVPIYLCAGVIFTLLLCVGVEFDLLGNILDKGYDLLLWAADTLSFGNSYVMEYQIPLYALCIWIMILSTSAFALNRENC